MAKEITPDKKILIESLKFIGSGEVLDLGSGEGLDSLFYAKNRFNVTAVDNLEQNIHDIIQLGKINNVSINAKLIDLKKLKLLKKYNIILCNYVFHKLKEKEARKLIKKMKEGTSDNGLNIITAFTKENPPKNFSFLLNVGELKEIYKEWEILYYEEYCTPIKPHLTVKPESIVEIIARKKK